MKKCLLFLGIVLINLKIEPVFSGDCTPIRCQESEHDVSEMLTEDGITGGPNNNKDGRFSGKMCYMCDTGGANTQCNYKDIVVIANSGGQHYAYECTDTAGADDTWKPVPENTMCTCADSPLTQMDGYIENAFLSTIRAGQCNRGSTSNPITQTGRNNAVCRHRECLKGYKALNGNMCVPETSSQPPSTKPSNPDNGTPPKNNGGGVTPPNNGGGKRPSCRDSRSTLNGKACCDTGSLGKYNSATDTCTCSGDLDFVIENGTGYCRAKQGAPVYTCPAAQLNWIANLKISCGNNTEIQSQIQMIENYCKGQGVSETAFNEYVSQLMTLSAQLCGANAQSDEEKLCEQISDAHMVGDMCTCDDENKEVNRSQRRCVESTAFNTAISSSTRRIEEAKNKLDSLAEGFSRSVWKTAEGKFNTSRLASDSIAAVVLGTAGGLITSNVIKKNQVENGFEDIQCTVGGQVVAGWGDEFRVGIQ